MHRSLYHLKEGDPHAWAIPRLTGQAKASFVAVEFDEYGGGRGEPGASAAIRRFAGCRRAGLVLSRLSRRRARRVAGGGEPDVAVRATPRVVRRGDRTFRVNRDHFLAGVAAPGRGAAADGRTRCRVSSSTPNTSRPTRCTSKWSVSTWSVTWWRREPRLDRDVVFGIRARDLVEDRLAAHMMDCWTARPLVATPTSRLTPRAALAPPMAGVAQRIALRAAARTDRHHEAVRFDHAAVGHLDAHRPLHEHRSGRHHPYDAGSASSCVCPL